MVLEFCCITKSNVLTAAGIKSNATEGGGVIECVAALQPFSVQQNVLDCQTSARKITEKKYIKW